MIEHIGFVRLYCLVIAWWPADLVSAIFERLINVVQQQAQRLTKCAGVPVSEHCLLCGHRCRCRLDCLHFAHASTKLLCHFASALSKIGSPKHAICYKVTYLVHVVVSRPHRLVLVERFYSYVCMRTQAS